MEEEQVGQHDGLDEKRTLKPKAALHCYGQAFVGLHLSLEADLVQTPHCFLHFISKIASTCKMTGSLEKQPRTVLQ